VLWSREVSGEVMFGLDLVGVIDCWPIGCARTRSAQEVIRGLVMAKK
jgi:hypothetical protein